MEDREKYAAGSVLNDVTAIPVPEKLSASGQGESLEDRLPAGRETTPEESDAQKKKIRPKKPRREKSGGQNRKSFQESEKKTAALLIAIIAVGVCLLLVSIVGLAATGSRLKKAKNTADAAEPSSQSAESVPQTVHSAAGTTASVAQDVSETAAAALPGGADSGTQGSAVPQSDAQWLAFFNASVNKLKTEGASFVKSKQTKTADIQLSNKLAQSYVSVVKDKFLSDETVQTEIAKGDTAAAVANVSPDGSSAVSSLTLNDVKSVTHTTDADGNYVIRITMPDATNPELDSSYGKIFTFITVDDVMNIYAPDIGASVDRANVSVSFAGCYAEATVTPDGMLVAYNTYVSAHMLLTEAKIKVITTDLDVTLISNTSYTHIVW